jgi:hypothetical protein
MRHRTSHVVTGAAITALALIVSFNSLPASAAATGAGTETVGSNSRRYGNVERSADGVPPRFDEQLLLLNNANADGAGAGADEDVYGQGEDEDGLNANEIKRKWGQKNLALWGKRRMPYADDDDDDVLAVKRKWGQKNMALWGKRGDRTIGNISPEKRKWGQKNMALWG